MLPLVVLWLSLTAGLAGLWMLAYLLLKEL